MYPGEIVAGVLFLVCFCLSASFAWRREVKDATFAAVCFGVCALVFGILSVGLATSNRTNARNDRDATDQIEQRDHVRVIELDTRVQTIRFIRDGKVCDGGLKLYEGKYLLADDDVCAGLPDQ